MVPIGSSPHPLRLFLDTADLNQWATWLPTGLFYGVTTNPLLLGRAQIPCTVDDLQDLAHQAFQWGAQEVQLQAWGTTPEALVAIGKQLATRPDRIVVKVPITRVGVEAAHTLIADGFSVTLTAVYSVHQVLMAAALQTAYAAPYLGRMTDLGQNGREEIVQMQQILRGLGSPCRLLVASLRQIDDLVYLATQGVNTFTLSPEVASAFFSVEATQRAAQDFQEAALAQNVE